MTHPRILQLTAISLLGMSLLVAGEGFAAKQNSAQPATSIALSAQTAGMIDAAVAQRLRELDQLIWIGDYRSAEQRARAALAELDASGAGGTVAAAETLDRLVSVLLVRQVGNLPDSVQAAQRAVSIKEKELGPNNPDTAVSLMQLGHVHQQAQELELAQAELMRAFDVLQSTLGPGHAKVAEAMFRIGSLQFFSDHCPDALPWLDKALDVGAAASGEGQATVARALAIKGHCALETADTGAAVALLRRAVEVADASVPERNALRADCRMRLAQALSGDGQFAEARVLLESALHDYESSFGTDAARLSWPLMALATLHSTVAEFGHAAILLERAIALDLQHYGSGSEQYASDLLTASGLKLNVHDYTGALALAEEGGRIYQEVYGPDAGMVGEALFSQTQALIALGQYADAEPRLQRALEIFGNESGPDSYDVAWSLTLLADIRLGLGDFVGARDAAERAVEIFRQAPGSTFLGLVAGDETLATVYHKSGETLVALAVVERNLVLAGSVYGNSHPAVAGLLVNRAMLLAELGRRDEAIRDATAGELLGRENLLVVARSSAEPEAVGYAAHRASGVDLLVTMATRVGGSEIPVAGAAADAVIRARALVLEQLADRRRVAFEARDPETASLLKYMRRASDRLSNLVIRGPREGDRPPYPQALAAARSDKERAERALAARSVDFRRSLVRSSVGLEAIREALPEGVALVAYVLFDSDDIAPRSPGDGLARRAARPAFGAYVLSSGRSTPEFVELGTAAAIESVVERWRRAIADQQFAAGYEGGSHGESSYRRTASELRRMVWDPVAEKLGGSERVFVVPDGALSLINFAALPVGETDYLADRGPAFHYLSAERDLLTGESPRGRRGSLLAVSGPDFDNRSLFAASMPESAKSGAAGGSPDTRLYRGPRSTCRSFRTLRFEALPASNAEAREISALWEQRPNDTLRDSGDGATSTVVVALSGPAANETTFKRSASGNQVLHLATHGFFLGDACTSAPASTGPVANSGSSVADVAREDPMLLSGLALAGANHRESAGADEDDGILTAEEITTLDLRDTDWVVLSACDTGVGETRAGEGVFGLRRAFQLAGARSVIMSLWPVEDEAARQWMSRLYRLRFVDGKSTMDAANGASRDMLRQRRARGESTHPFHWAGFIATGDWR